MADFSVSSAIARVVLATSIVAASSSAMAWDGSEHISIGSEAFHGACAQAWSRYADAPDDKIRTRLAIACGRVSIGIRGAFERHDTIFAYETLFGEWSALAADHTQKPEQLTNIELGDIVADYRLFGRIATTNYRHFHPASVISWRSDHLKALQAAAAAAATPGIQQVEQFEDGLAIEAFAQHYLQDSFAAGHMGFNRVASSNAAALAYHDRASQRGRCVMNFVGTAWFTYGDGNLARSTEGKKHVIDTATMSLFDFVDTFVSGTPDPTRWQAAWLQLPAYLKETADDSPQDCQNGGEYYPLRSVSRPAESIRTLDVSSITDPGIWNGEPVVKGLMFGGSNEFIYTIPLGYRTVQSRIAYSIGGTIHQRTRALLGDVTYLWHVGTSLNGTLTHEVGLGQMYYYQSRGRYRSGSLRLLYAVNMELGRVYLRFQVAASHGYHSWGPYVSTGMGWVLRSK